MIEEEIRKVTDEVFTKSVLIIMGISSLLLFVGAAIGYGVTFKGYTVPNVIVWFFGITYTLQLMRTRVVLIRNLHKSCNIAEIYEARLNAIISIEDILAFGLMMGLL